MIQSIRYDIHDITVGDISKGEISIVFSKKVTNTYINVVVRGTGYECKLERSEIQHLIDELKKML